MFEKHFLYTFMIQKKNYRINHHYIQIINKKLLPIHENLTIQVFEKRINRENKKERIYFEKTYT